MRRIVWTVVLLLVLCVAALASASSAWAGEEGNGDGPPTPKDRVENLQEDLDSLIEDIDDLQEPVAEFELFDQCMYVIGVSEFGRPGGAFGYFFDADGQLGQATPVRRPALAMDMRGFGRPQYEFLAFPGEEPPSIECNEDAGQEITDG